MDPNALMTMGTKMGLTGEKLLEFVTKQQQMYTEEQAKQREERIKE